MVDKSNIKRNDFGGINSSINQKNNDDV